METLFLWQKGKLHEIFEFLMFSTIATIKPDDVSKRKILFTGTADGDWSRDTEINSLLNMIFCCGIWYCKLGKKVPSFTTIEENMLTIFDSCLYISTSLAEIATTSLSPICRLWRNRHGRG